MSEMTMVLEAAERLFSQHCDDPALRAARDGAWPVAWDAVAEMGLPLALVDEAAGGYGLDPVEAGALVRLSGSHALPLPLGETMVANAALAAAGLPPAPGVAAIVPGHPGLVPKDGRITGTAAGIPWGAQAGMLVVEVAQGAERTIVRLDEGWAVGERCRNLAGMPRDTLRIDAPVAVAATGVGPPLLHLGAAVRALQIAGALERVLALTIDYVFQREQFGRALSKFQAVQHELAKLASEVAAASAAGDMAAETFAGGPVTALAAARIRSGEAVGIAAGIAQQLHGAIGFTQEHRLHFFTTALWSWRDEYGSHGHWTQLLGRAALAQPGDAFWAFVTEAA